MLMMGGDYDLNTLQVPTDSFKEILRQTILNQEVIFRKQVHELHQLYTTQMTLMKDCGLREMNGYKIGNETGTQSTFGPFSDQVGTTQSVWNNVVEGRGFCSRLQQRPLDLQLSSSNCCNWNFTGKSNERSCHFHNNEVYCPDEVDLSLSIGGGDTKKGVGRAPFTQKIICTSCPEVIDLEDSEEMLSNDNNESVFTVRCGGHITSEHKEKPQIPVQSFQNFMNILLKDSSNVLARTDSFVGSTGISHERNFTNKGPDDCYIDVPCDSISRKGKSFKPNVAIDLDLNKTQFDESFSQSNDSVLAYPSAVSSSGDAIPGMTDSNSNSNGVNVSATNSKSESGNKVCSIDLESVSEFQSGLSEESGDHCRNMVMLLNFQSRNQMVMARPEERKMKADEDLDLKEPFRSQSALGVAHCSRSPSCVFDCIADDNRIITGTMQSGEDPGKRIQTTESSQLTKTICQPNSSSGISEIKLQSRDKKKWESAEVDINIQDAASSLIFISMENANNNDSSTIKSGSNGIIKGKEREQPERPCDSYESMVLKQAETSVDDHCVTSNPFEVNELEMKDSSIKLRRGRRLKDFQKDILPGMASLSRHEIWEDINIMEGVMRSREYKRLRSKTALANAGNWFTPVKSKRSRINNVGRRYYS